MSDPQIQTVKVNSRRGIWHLRRVGFVLCYAHVMLTLVTLLNPLVLRVIGCALSKTELRRVIPDIVEILRQLVSVTPHQFQGLGPVCDD